LYPSRSTHYAYYDISTLGVSGLRELMQIEPLIKGLICVQAAWRHF
jgi:hypothetical protein